MQGPPITFRRLRTGDAPVLAHVAPGVFDNEIRGDHTAAFLGAGYHEMVVALVGDLVVAMCSAVVYHHPDKPAQMWINEVGTGDDWRRRGIALELTGSMVAIARLRGCGFVWLGTESDNAPALNLYRKAGGREVPGLVMFDWGEEAGAPATDT